MAQKVTGFIKLQIPAGKATPAPPVGPALLVSTASTSWRFTKEFNERTKNDVGLDYPCCYYGLCRPFFYALSQRPRRLQF